MQPGELARTSQEEDNWNQYKLLRNECTRLQKAEKKIYLEGMYNNIEKENDTGRLYSLTKQFLGWKSSGPPSRFNIKL